MTTREKKIRLQLKKKSSICTRVYGACDRYSIIMYISSNLLWSRYALFESVNCDLKCKMMTTPKNILQTLNISISKIPAQTKVNVIFRFLLQHHYQT